MPAMTKTYLIGGAALLALLMGSKKSSAKSTKSSSGTGSTDPKKDDDGKGDAGEPAGPNGCAGDLIVKNGICVDPKNPNGDGSGSGNGSGSGGSLKASDLYYSQDCKTIKFGDKTGEAWWKAKGKSKAQDWLAAQYKNLILIAYGMLKDNKPVCFKEFPLQEKYETNFELNAARLDWIVKFPAVWTLLYTVRNLIDKNLLNGKTFVKLDELTWKLEFGKGYKFEELWAVLEPLAFTILYIEQEKPGSVLKKFGWTYPNYDKAGNAVVNTVMVLYAIMFPYVDRQKMFKIWGTLDKTPFYSNLWDYVAALENASFEYDMEQ